MKFLATYIDTHATIIFLLAVIVGLFIGILDIALGPVISGYAHIVNPFRS